MASHRKDLFGVGIFGERKITREDLRPTQADEYLETGKRKMTKLTSQASMPNANMSVALVLRTWTGPKVYELMSSGAILQNDLSDSTSDQLMGREGAKAEPKPPRRATLSLSTRTFLYRKVNTWWRAK